MKRIIPVVMMLVTSCSNNISFTPKEKELPDGKVGSFYYSLVRANYPSGDLFYFQKNNTSIDISPNDTGLVITPPLINKNDNEYYDNNYHIRPS